jgi:hypothetical protein
MNTKPTPQIIEVNTMQELHESLLDIYAEGCARNDIVYNTKDVDIAVRSCTQLTFLIMDRLPDELLLKFVREMARTAPTLEQMKTENRRRDS